MQLRAIVFVGPQAKQTTGQRPVLSGKNSVFALQEIIRECSERFRFFA